MSLCFQIFATLKRLVSNGFWTKGSDLLINLLGKFSKKNSFFGYIRGVKCIISFYYPPKISILIVFSGEFLMFRVVDYMMNSRLHDEKCVTWQPTSRNNRQVILQKVADLVSEKKV